MLINRQFMTHSVYTSILSKKSGAQKSFALLIDPDKVTPGDSTVYAGWPWMQRSIIFLWEEAW